MSTSRSNADIVLTPHQAKALGQFGADLIGCLTRICYGDNAGPTGLEGLAMALAKGNEGSVSVQLGEVASAIRDLAEAVRSLKQEEE